MVDKTLGALITGVEKRLRMVAGLNTQVYAKDAIAQEIQTAFDFVFADKEWKRFNRREQRTLDGTTGQVTADFTEILSYDEIIRVFPANSDRALTYLNPEHNVLLNSTGGLPRFIEYNATPGKLITCWPLDAAGDIVVTGKYKQQAEFAIDQVVPFDALALELFAAWSMSVDDGANTEQSNKLQALFEIRKKSLYETQTKTPISLNDRSDYIPSRWSE